MSDTAATNHVLELTQRLEAPRKRVFQAFVTPAGLEQWFGPDTTTARVHELDVRVGGRYAVDIVSPAGDTYRVSGIYRHIDPPRLLEFTWIWGQGDYAGRETIVRVALNDLGPATELRLTHRDLADAEAVGLHAEGWQSSFTSLSRAISVSSG